MPDIDLGDNYSIDEDSNGDLIIRHDPSGDEIKYDAANNGFVGNNFNSVSTADLSNVHILPKIDGSTLNAKWDNLRSSFVGGESYAILIPPPEDGSDPAAGEFANGTHYWKVDAPLTFNNVENFGDIYCFRTNIVNDGTLSRFLDIGATEKPENIDIRGGTWRCKDGGATEIARVHSGARIRFHGLKAGANTSTVFERGIHATAASGAVDTLTVRDFQGGVFSDATIVMDGQSSTNANYLIDSVRGSGQDVVRLRGDAPHGTVRHIRGTFDDPVTRAGVRCEVTSVDRPDNATIEDVVMSGSGVTAVQAVDTSGGSGFRHRELTIRDLSVPSGETVLEADYCDGCDFDIGTTDLPFTISITNTEDSRVDFDGRRMTLNESGNTRLVRNGYGVNAGDPRAAGQWENRGWDGLVVRDTTNSVTYRHVGGSYQQV